MTMRTLVLVFIGFTVSALVVLQLQAHRILERQDRILRAWSPPPGPFVAGCTAQGTLLGKKVLFRIGTCADALDFQAGLRPSWVWVAELAPRCSAPPKRRAGCMP